MARITLNQCAASDIPVIIGCCANDLPTIANAVNRAQERLLFAKEAGDEAFHGGWAEMAFNVLQSDPYIAGNRWIGRLMNANVCKHPVAINNQFYEYLLFGDGRQPRGCCANNTGGGSCGGGDIYARGFFPTFRDMTAGHLIRVRALDPLDVSGNKRTLIQGTDAFDHTITSLDPPVRVQGVYLNIVSPFVDTPMPLNSLTGIQKDATNGPVQYWDVDPVTAVETLILTMEGGEMVSGYPRYYLQDLPLTCCPVATGTTPTVQVTALVKLNLVPVIAPTDYLLFQCMEAIMAECQSMRYDLQDLPASKAMAERSHKKAMGYLNGELTHYYGTQNPAVSVLPFGSARLENQRIGLLI